MSNNDEKWNNVYQENKEIGIVLSDYRRGLDWDKVVKTNNWQNILQNEKPNLPDHWYLMRYPSLKEQIFDLLIIIAIAIFILAVILVLYFKSAVILLSYFK